MIESLFSTADALLLARIQFAFTVAFHIIFPAFTIGIASYLAVLEGLYLKTRNPVYQKLFRFWLKIFAVAFGMGVVSGIVMSYQFGTNWSVFSDKAGPVIGPLMGYEVLTAFFLEAGFLGVMLFGMNRVGEGLHFFATLMVAIGTAISAFWILSVNSWMQTPAGFGMNEVGQYIVEDWLAVIFNPSFPYRFVHMLLAAYLTTAFVVGGVGAWHLLRNRSNAAARKMFSMAMWMALLVAPLQVVVGDLHGLNTQEHQPAKVAAMEGHFESKPRAPLHLFGLPNEETARVDYALSVPALGSLILKHDINAEVTGLDAFPRDEWPPVAIVFWAFRVMVGIGMLMLVVGVWAGIQRARGKLYQASRLHKSAVLMAPAGFVAVIAGWIVTEVGRQPWVIYGLLRTEDAVSAIAAEGVGGSLLAFIAVYFLVFGAGTVYILRKMAADPDQVHIPDYAKHQHAGMASERLMHEED
ncbi:cytochrome ubiquinol oxidase subunit I [Pseudidiomarina halophila]|uniref:Cytochrome ubiquinol oxidase subunit I n=1 Tax=Pseudidiomarina halophila TaxID=1449799 RepID=A0A432XW40_9GAMM|nr:cytochrome ubiquinol oxidase subunit I [Pseudidiomarina halophila]RUO52834.1 cytochrome ubiquinol oxidase subunit I [Pseudidiomarina halophila]